MAVTTTYAPLTYNGSGSVGPFPVTWQFVSRSHLKVTLISAAGVETVKTFGAHYTVTGGASVAGIPGVGTVTMVTGHAPLSGQTLRIERVTSRVQGTVLTENGAFPAKAVEAALDRSVLIAQEATVAGSYHGTPLLLNEDGAGGYWNAGAYPVRLAAPPVDGSDAANKDYVASVLAGITTGTTYFQQIGTGATNRSWLSKLRDEISVYDFGAVGDGTTNDTAAFQAAIDSLGAKGGVVHVPRTGKFLIGNVTIKANTGLRGEVVGHDSTPNNINFSFSGIGSALLTQASTTITIQTGGALENCILYPAVLAANLDDMTSASSFAGTAITIAGHGPRVAGNIILGYNKALLSNGYARAHVVDNSLDCHSGFDVQASYDTFRILNNQAWPFLTNGAFWNSGVDYASRDKTKLYRNGIGLRLYSGSDDTRVDGNLFYGFLVGIELQSVNGVNAGINWVDHPFGVSRANNIGVYFRNNVTDILMQSLMIYGVKNAIVGEMNATENVLIDLVHADVIDSVAVSISGGDFYIGALHAESVGSYAVSIGSSASTVNIDSYQFRAIGAPQPIAIPSGGLTNKIVIGKGGWDGVAGASLLGVNALAFPTVASADPLPLPVNGDTFQISGTTSFATISGGWGGRRVTLIFQSALTISDSGNVNIVGDFVAAANDTLDLIYYGTGWIEGGRTNQSSASLPSYTVAALPVTGSARIAYASNGRKNGEGATAGTGVLVFRDGTAWRACDTGATVTA